MVKVNRRQSGEILNILFASYNDWGGASALLSKGINQYTEHHARCITEAHHPFKYDTDIVLSNVTTAQGMSEVDDLIADADFFFIGQQYPPSIEHKIRSRRNVHNSLFLYGGSDVRKTPTQHFQIQLINHYWSFTYYDFTMTRCLIQSCHHNNHILDTDKWAPSKSVKKDSDPVFIYHSPTNNAIKGTEYISEAIEQLSKTYSIEWIHTGCDTEGKGGIAWTDVMQTKAKADIFIDSIEMHEHGQNAAEGMCFGIPVLNRLSNYYLAMYPDSPIIQTDKHTIFDNLKYLLENPKERQTIGQTTRQYCVNMYSIKANIDKWIPIIEFIMNPTSDPIYPLPFYWQRQEQIFAKNIPVIY